MLPSGHRRRIVCDSRRAARWRRAFQAVGLAAIVVETDTHEAAAGAAKVCVPKRRLLEANAIVTAITTGQRSLPGITLPWQAVIVLSLLTALVARWSGPGAQFGLVPSSVASSAQNASPVR